MRERPILFTGENVLRILRGEKTQTRRVLTMPARFHGWEPSIGSHWTPGMHDSEQDKPTLDSEGLHVEPHGSAISYENEGTYDVLPCPYGRAGDRLWVKETWRVSKKHDKTKPSELPFERGLSVAYAAGGSRSREEGGPYVTRNEIDLWNASWMGKSRPSIFMSRWASRVLLEITDVRVERVHEISPRDAWAEGVRCECTKPTPQCAGNVDAYRRLWNEINGGDRKKEWITRGENETVSSPWVWCITFKPIKGG